MSLARKLANLETIVSARSEDAVPTYWTEQRVEAWRAWVIRLLETMPEDRARQVFEELATQPADRWGPVTRRVHDMACAGADGRYDRATWPYWSERVVALPGTVCEALEQYPDAGYVWDFSCEACGLELPHRAGVAQPDAALFETCPLCGGPVRHCGYTHRRLRDVEERQKAEAARAERPAPR